VRQEPDAKARVPKSGSAARVPPESVKIAASEFSVTRIPREGNHVPDIGHARDELHHPFEAQPESAVGCGAEFPQIEVPPELFLRKTELADAVQQFAVIGLPF